MARILVVDNYDSFVWNIVSYLAQIGAEVGRLEQGGRAATEEDRLDLHVAVPQHLPGEADLADRCLGVRRPAGADLVAQHVLPAVMSFKLSVPVGVVTGAVGGPYLIWLMAAGRTRTS